MAIAHLVNPRPVDGGLAYEIDASPFDAEPFVGPTRRTWTGFRLVDGGAEYHWRTRADRFLAASRALARGAAVEEVLREEAVADYVSRLWEDFDPSVHEEYEDDPVPESEIAFARWLLPRISWEDLVEYDGPRSAYGAEDDGFLREAARALDLPTWASRRRIAAGGPGTGYDAAFVVIRDGHTLEELAAWARQQEAR
jgi:hypothetical protein